MSVRDVMGALAFIRKYREEERRQSG